MPRMSTNEYNHSKTSDVMPIFIHDRENSFEVQTDIMLLVFISFWDSFFLGHTCLKKKLLVSVSVLRRCNRYGAAPAPPRCSTATLSLFDLCWRMTACYIYLGWWTVHSTARQRMLHFRQSVPSAMVRMLASKLPMSKHIMRSVQHWLKHCTSVSNLP